MKVSDVLGRLGKEYCYNFKFTWSLDEESNSVMDTDCFKSAMEIFGDNELCEESSIYFYTNENIPYIHLYIKR